MHALWPWLEAYGVQNDVSRRQFFGFNNPSPSIGSPNYGYEQWVTAEPDELGVGAVVIKQFGGGRYGLIRCQLEHIQESWAQLALWLEHSHYTMGQHQWLEACLTPEALLRGDTSALEFDLYIPLAE